MPEMQKKIEVTVFVSDVKRVENYPDFDKLAHVIQHSLQGFRLRLHGRGFQSKRFHEPNRKRHFASEPISRQTVFKSIRFAVYTTNKTVSF